MALCNTLKDRRIRAISFVFQGISAVILIEQFTEYGGNPEDIQRETRFSTKVGLFPSHATDINPVFAPISHPGIRVAIREDAPRESTNEFGEEMAQWSRSCDPTQMTGAVAKRMPR
jgi:hypothetical protein